MSGCCEEDEYKPVKQRFIGGKDKPRALQGPYHSFETGKIYDIPIKYSKLPYWEIVEEEFPTETEEVETEIGFEHTDKEVPPPRKPRGLTKKFTGAPPSPKDFIEGMNEEDLRSFIGASGGRVDKRWGKKRLVEEALKLQ